jgi:hypothetical protein
VEVAGSARWAADIVRPGEGRDSLSLGGVHRIGTPGSRARQGSGRAVGTKRPAMAGSAV